MGRGKPRAGQAAGPETEAGQLRDLIRQAHEAAQDARAAARELKALHAALDATLAGRIDGYTGAIHEIHEESLNKLAAVIRAAEESVADAVAAHLGAEDWRELLKFVIDGIGPDLLAATEMVVTERLPGLVAAQTVKTITGEEYVKGLARALREEFSHRRDDAARVEVVTGDQAAELARQHSGRIVIDLRR